MHILVHVAYFCLEVYRERRGSPAEGGSSEMEVACLKSSCNDLS